MSRDRDARPGLGNTRLRAQLGRHAQYYLVGVTLLALYQIAQYWFDIRLSSVINAALARDRDLARWLALQLGLVALVALTLRAFAHYSIMSAGRQAEYQLRRALNERLLKLGPSYFRRVSSGQILSRLSNDLPQVRLLLGFAVLQIGNTAFATVSALAVVVPLSPELALSALVPVPLLLILTRVFSRRFYLASRDHQEAVGTLTTQAQSSVATTRLIRTFALEDSRLSAFAAANRACRDQRAWAFTLRGLFGLAAHCIVVLGVLFVFWRGGELVIQNELDAGRLVACLRSLIRLAMPLVSWGFVLSLVQRGRAAHARLTDILDAEPDVCDGAVASPGVGAGHLRVHDLHFAHAGVPIVQGISFELSPGRSLAIVGPTGAGKTTLALLLVRLLQTPPNSVFVDGVDACQLPLAQLRRTVVYAAQEPFLFSASAKQNIGFALDDLEGDGALAVIRSAAASARVLDEVLRLPKGFDTLLGERGVELSGGQKQRMSLAMAYAANPSILVLDEPLSAVDADTARSMLDALARRTPLRSLILITHRADAAKLCDEILVLEGGKIMERGNHEQLCAARGPYSALVLEQCADQALDAYADGREGGHESLA